MTVDPSNLNAPNESPNYSAELDRALDLLNAMIPDGTLPCTADMTLGTLIAEKSLYPDLIVEAFDIAVPGATLEKGHFVPERTIEQLISLLTSKAAVPDRIDF